MQKIYQHEIIGPCLSGSPQSNETMISSPFDNVLYWVTRIRPE